MTKFSIENDGLIQLQKQIKELAGLKGVTKAVEKALIATDDYVTAETQKAVRNSIHEGLQISSRTGRQIDLDKSVEWEGTTATAKAGFRITQPNEPNGINLTSIYLMYGTNPKKGKGVRPDTNLKNAVKVQGIHRNNINKIQQEEFNKVIKDFMENGND